MCLQTRQPVCSSLGLPLPMALVDCGTFSAACGDIKASWGGLEPLAPGEAEDIAFGIWGEGRRSCSVGLWAGVVVGVRCRLHIEVKSLSRITNASSCMATTSFRTKMDPATYCEGN